MTIRWKPYEEPDLTSIKLGSLARSGYDTMLTKACCANYAQTRRNVICHTLNLSGHQITCQPFTTEEWTEWLRVPIGGRVVGPGKVSVWILYTGNSENTANNILFQVSIGNYTGRGAGTVSSKVWKEIEVELEDQPGVDDDLVISFKTRGSNIITIYSVSAYQTGGYNSEPDWVDLDDANCVLGDDDYPDGVFAMKLLRDNVVACRGWKVPKANVYNHWYRDFYKVGVDYGADNGALGRYKFVKRRDISECKLHVLATKAGTNDPTLRCEVTGTTNPIAAQTQTIAQTSLDAGGGASEWETLTFTFTGADITSEKECELLVDGKDLVGGTSQINVMGLYLVESAPSAAITHTVPDPANTGPSSVIHSSWVDNVRTTCNHLWLYGGRQILVADWRWEEDTSTYDQGMQCDADAFDKTEAGANDPNSVITRAILFSSKNSERLRCRLGYYTTSGATETKLINIQTSENTAHGTQIDADPRYDNDTDNDMQFLNARTDEIETSCELDIRDADQEEHYDGANEPPQVFIQSISNEGGGTASEYVIPTYVSVEEIELNSSEFP